MTTQSTNPEREPNPVPELLRRGAEASFGRGQDLRVVDDVADQLIAFEQFDPLGLGSRALVGAIEALYEGGWQPSDVQHVVRRQQNSAVSALAAAVIIHESRLADAGARAPESWVRQLAEIGAAYPAAATPVPTSTSLLAAVLKAGGKTDYIALNDQWIAVLTLLGQFRTFPMWPRIGPLPSHWQTRRIDRTVLSPRQSDAPNEKMLGRIRGLLAKADATDFEEEADTLTAKAQELMTKYSIDSLFLTEGPGDIVSRRVHIDNPHAPAKARLLHGVAEVNRAKTIWDPAFSTATLVGSSIDVEQTEVMFTALLIQATRALARSPKAKQRKGSASAAFGKAFLFSFAVRIGERLEQADAHALEEASRRSGDLLPVLAARAVAVDEEFERLFPRARTVSGPSLDIEGWESGHAAADEAELNRDR